MKNITLEQLKKNTSEVTDLILEGNFDLYDYCHKNRISGIPFGDTGL